MNENQHEELDILDSIGFSISTARARANEIHTRRRYRTDERSVDCVNAMSAVIRLQSRLKPLPVISIKSLLNFY